MPAAGLESARVRLQNGCSPSELCGLEIHKRPRRTRPIENLRCPETTVCRSTKGDQYRISGPSYVLAGTAILKRNHFTSSRDLSAPAFVRRLRSVDVIEIDLAGLSLGDPAALGDDAHERKRHRRGEDPLVGIPSLVLVRVISRSLPWGRGRNPSAVLRSGYPGPGGWCAGLCQIIRTLLRRGHARPIARPNKRSFEGGFRDDM